MRIDEATFALIDTETTRKDAKDPENELLEVAVDLYGRCGADHLGSFSSLVYVTRPIPPENSAVHNLTTRDTIYAPERAVVIQQLQEFVPADAVPVAHNAAFDSQVLADVALGEWLCTERLAHHLTPHAANFKLATLRYTYGILDIDYEGIADERRSHSATGDLRVLAPVFFRLLDKYQEYVAEIVGADRERSEKAQQVETLIAFAKRPYVMAHFPNFGKHAGVPFPEVPLDYFEWCLSPRGLTDMDDDLRRNIQRELKRRQAA
jgi:DNA polymerase III epsilon subunit-like protein